MTTDMSLSEVIAGPRDSRLVVTVSLHVHELMKFQDVRILEKICLQFCELVLQYGGVDPFIETTTLAGTAFLVFRRGHLKPNRISLMPRGGK